MNCTLYELLNCSPVKTFMIQYYSAYVPVHRFNSISLSLFLVVTILNCIISLPSDFSFLKSAVYHYSFAHSASHKYYFLSPWFIYSIIHLFSSSLFILPVQSRFKHSKKSTYLKLQYDHAAYFHFQNFQTACGGRGS